MDSNSARVSDKVSDLMTRFGSSDKIMPFPPPSSSSSSLTSKTLSRSDPNKQRHVERVKSAPLNGDERVVEERPQKVGDVAKRFNSNSETAKPPSEGGFASAHDRFRRAEEAERRPTETRVSSFAKRIESGSKSFDASSSSERHVAGVARAFESKGTESKTVTDQPASFDSVVSKFESGDFSDINLGSRTSRHTDNQVEELESLGERFANATKLFESGAASNANPKRKQTGSEETNEKSSQSRFADAARVFGGSRS